MNNMNSKVKSQQLVKMAMMAALACVVGLIRFPLIPAVSFLTYDFADIPILITTFAFGPASGMLVLGVVSFIQAFRRWILWLYHAHHCIRRFPDGRGTDVQEA